MHQISQIQHLHRAKDLLLEYWTISRYPFWPIQDKSASPHIIFTSRTSIESAGVHQSAKCEGRRSTLKYPQKTRLSQFECYLTFAYSSHLQMVLNPGKILRRFFPFANGRDLDASHMQTGVSVEVCTASRFSRCTIHTSDEGPRGARCRYGGDEDTIQQQRIGQRGYTAR